MKKIVTSEIAVTVVKVLVASYFKLQQPEAFSYFESLLVQVLHSKVAATENIPYNDTE